MNKHSEAVAAFQQGNPQDALQLFDRLLQAEDASSELWNDWATVQSACGELRKAETGFLRALELDPANHQAKSNLGLLLIGLGEFQRALPLLEEALPWLPEQEQELLRAALAAAGEKARQSSVPIQKKSIAALLIDDVMPQARSHGSEPRPLQIARMLRKLGHQTTLVLRDGRNRDPWEPTLRKLGVRVFADDAEHLRSLGREIPHSGWSFQQLLAENKFDLAFLTENFERGVSVPEHYLDEIRRYSPATRIAIISDNFHGCNAGSRFDASGELRHHEVAENWSQREWEAFQRADQVIVPTEGAAQWLREEKPSLHIQTVPLTKKRSAPASGSLAQTIEQAVGLVPKPAAGPFSVNLVESIYVSLLQGATGEQRVYARLDFYIQLAEQLLRKGQPQFAREQLRHIFGWLGDSIKLAPALAQPLGLLKRCYSQLGDEAMAVRCSQEARRCFAGLSKAAPPAAPLPLKKDKERLLLSLIVPSYNRLPILKKCLSALAGQTVSASLFEVIVIDDGSTDGTEDFMRNYSAPFRLQYLRQSNAGTGAARRNGVEHATGEYLLLMNDDTICEPNVLEEHLKAQQAYSAHRWAVLGDFEYPAEARRRALTHFLRESSFMFPQVDMTEGCPYAYSHFITCNLSIRRDAVVQAGSFDSTYKLSEDTELGIRLFEMGYGVIYHPAAHAWHDHLPYAVPNLIRRARVYGADYFYMFRNHPRVMKEWGMPLKLQGMDERDANCIHAYLESNRAQVQAAVAAMERWDAVDFEPMLANPQVVTHVLSLFQQAVPAVHWFYLFESMLDTMVKELGLPILGVAKLPAQAAHAG